MDARTAAFERLLEIMDVLRLNCPWDKQQTLDSLRHLTIEETYELSDAILEGDLQDVKKELGDLMLHIVFYSKIGSEKEEFDIKDVLESINEKLILRHPHIFGDVEVADADEGKNNWERIKLQEGRSSVLEGVPKSVPPLVKAYRIQEQARGVGFDWEKPHQVWDKVMEEQSELLEAVDSEIQDKMEEEFGDLLFALVNYARFIGVNPEDALEKTNKKFIKRFKYLEENVALMGKSLKDMRLAEMDEIWDEAKKFEINHLKGKKK